MVPPFHPGTLDLLALRYEPVATIPGLVVARYRTRPDVWSRHWLRLCPQSRHRCGAAGGLAESTEFLILTALSKASYWCHVRQWRTPHISLPIRADELCEHSGLPRLLARAMSSSSVRARHLTVEVTAREDVALCDIERTLRRLHDMGIRVSYDRPPTSTDYQAFTFDEVRIDLGSSDAHAGATRVTGCPPLLANGVSTGDQLMTALSAGARFIDGSFAGTTRTDRTIQHTPTHRSDRFAYS